MRLSKALHSVMLEPSPSTELPQPVQVPKVDEQFRLPKDALQILKKHWRISGILFVGLLSLITLAIFMAPRSYNSESKLFVRVGRESITLDPTATTGQTISVYESRENEINSVIDVLQSRVILERIVEKLENELREDSGDTSKPLTPLEKDALVRSVGNNINVSHGKKSSVINITAQATTPELAQRILQEMLIAFREQHLRVNRTQGSYEFFIAQSKHVEHALETARGKLRDAKNTFGLVTVEGQRKNLESHVNTIESELMKNERALKSAQAEVHSLIELAKHLPAQIQAQAVTGFFNDAREQTREQLHQLQIEHSQLLAKFTSRHSRVQAVQEKIDAAQAILSRNTSLSSQETNTINPAYQQLELKRLTEQSRVDALIAEQNSLKAQHQDLQTSLAKLNHNEIELANLQQQVDLLQASSKVYGEKLEQSRIDQKLEEDSISNVNVVQPATFLPKAVSPKRQLIFAFGFIAAFISACGYGFVREYAAGNLAFAQKDPQPSEPGFSHSQN